MSLKQKILSLGTYTDVYSVLDALNTAINEELGLYTAVETETDPETETERTTAVNIYADSEHSDVWVSIRPKITSSYKEICCYIRNKLNPASTSQISSYIFRYSVSAAAFPIFLGYNRAADDSVKSFGISNTNTVSSHQIAFAKDDKGKWSVIANAAYFTTDSVLNANWSYISNFGYNAAFDLGIARMPAFTEQTLYKKLYKVITAPAAFNISTNYCAGGRYFFQPFSGFVYEVKEE